MKPIIASRPAGQSFQTTWIGRTHVTQEAKALWLQAVPEMSKFTRVFHESSFSWQGLRVHTSRGFG